VGSDWIKKTDFAHRGLHGLSDNCPENSLAAIDEAVQHGYGIEIDVQRSADYEAIVFHDTNLNRMTELPGPVVNRSSGQLRETRLAGSSEKIPTLRQVLDLVNGRAPLLVEIKSSPGPVVPGVLEQRVATLLESYPGPVGVMSLSPNPIAWLGVLAPRLLLGNVVLKQTPLQKLRQRNKPILAGTLTSADDAHYARTSADSLIFEGFRL
jgi:glycerophosphoryl diester phosphodiesterase